MSQIPKCISFYDRVIFLWVRMSHAFLTQSSMVDTQVDPTSWLLQMLLQGKEGYICLFWIFSDQYPEMKLLCLVVVLFWIFWETSITFSIKQGRHRGTKPKWWRKSSAERNMDTYTLTLKRWLEPWLVWLCCLDGHATTDRLWVWFLLGYRSRLQVPILVRAPMKRQLIDASVFLCPFLSLSINQWK